MNGETRKDAKNAGREKQREKRKRVDWEGRYKRARADYTNLERRGREQQEEFVKFANSVLILKLLPILDDLEKAVRAKENDGLDLVLKKFKEVLKSEGVEEIKVKKGDEFDPNTMECTVADLPEADSGEEAKVSEVTRKGYKAKEKVLRPARVRVGNSKSEIRSSKQAPNSKF